MTCRKMLVEQGSLYIPSVCTVCGAGPCQFRPDVVSTADLAEQVGRVADAILKLADVIKYHR